MCWRRRGQQRVAEGTQLCRLRKKKKTEAETKGCQRDETARKVILGAGKESMYSGQCWDRRYEKRQKLGSGTTSKKWGGILTDKKGENLQRFASEQATVGVPVARIGEIGPARNDLKKTRHLRKTRKSGGRGIMPTVKKVTCENRNSRGLHIDFRAM